MTPEFSPACQLNTCFAPLLDRVIVLTGPTASGKTQLALRLAETLAGAAPPAGYSGQKHLPSIEIVSLDSITVYRRMDIGTAKPSLHERAQIPHHLIDVVEPDQEYSVAEYLAAAHRCVDEIESRGNRALFVGGTPMYLKAVLRGFDAGPPADESFREAVMQDVQRYGTEALRKRLEQVDPVSASRIDSQDTRRMIRALEFARQTGVPISHRQIQFETERSPSDGLVFVLQTPRAVLHQRIAHRVDEMFAGGLIDEIRQLTQDYPSLSKTSRTAVGYREVLESEYWTGGELPAEAPATSLCEFNKTAIKVIAEQVLFHTRRLARRQETWFRSLGEIRELSTHHAQDRPRPIDELVAELVPQIVAHPIWNHQPPPRSSAANYRPSK